MTSRKKGITVLICCHNSEDNLPQTLDHLSKQKTSNIEWEILLINNASTDRTVEVARKNWQGPNNPAPLIIVDESRQGKDVAMDIGLKYATYGYVIVCDDDNWLNDNYLAYAFMLMEENPDIGMMGGRGIPEISQPAPPWMSMVESYYAVGGQNAISGELKHYWPVYRFLWGAGTVINMETYELLMASGFTRILTVEHAGKVARSEDVELCFAIWLCGYKLWYDKNLIYRHKISDDRLQWNYLMGIIKLSVASIHYLRPYQVLLFTGSKHAPQKSYWQQHIVHYLKLFFRQFHTLKDLRVLLNIWTDNHQETNSYLNKAIVWYQFWGVLTMGKKYDALYDKVVALQKRIDLRRAI